MKNEKWLNTSVYDITSKIVDQITLPSPVFNAPVNEQLISLAVRNYLANQRSSHAKAKNRSEVAGTTKKVWAQKGTGRARHGSRKAPIFVGGGATHAPHGDRNFKTSLNKKTKKKVIYSLLTKFVKNKNILVIDKFNTIQPKTKIGWHLIDQLEKQNENLAKSRKIGILASKTLTNVRRAFNNNPGFNLLSLKSLNVYDLANQNFLIITKKTIEKLSKQL